MYKQGYQNYKIIYIKIHKEILLQMKSEKTLHSG